MCNFSNNAATIRIFVKGLKNAHTLAACIYEKGCQTLADAISEVEKLQVAQQLIATLLPSSTVNVGKSMLPVPRVRPHHTSLPKCMLF